MRSPRSNDPVSGNRLRECLQNLETLESNPFTKVCKDTSLCKRVSIGMCYKTVADEEMVLEIELQHAESFHTLMLSQIAEFMPQFQDEHNWTSSSSSYFSVSWHSWIEIQIPSTITPDRNSWVVRCRG